MFEHQRQIFVNFLKFFNLPVGCLTEHILWTVTSLVGLLPPEKGSRFYFLTRFFIPFLFIPYISLLPLNVQLVRYVLQKRPNNWAITAGSWLMVVSDTLQIIAVFYFVIKRKVYYEEKARLEEICDGIGAKRSAKVPKVDTLFVLLIFSYTLLHLKSCKSDEIVEFIRYYVWNNGSYVICHWVYDICIVRMLSSKILLFYIVASLSKIIGIILDELNSRLQLRGPAFFDEFLQGHQFVCEHVEHLNNIFSIPLRMSFASIMLHIIVSILSIAGKPACIITSITFNLLGTVWMCHTVGKLKKQVRICTSIY